ncbi:MAG: hypothetical protein AAFR32_05580 [Pseudomonadota bacterium]
MSVAIAAKLLAIGFVAALAASIAFGALLTLNGALNQTAYNAFSIAVLGSYAIGFPVAFLTFTFAGQHMASSPSIIAMIAALSSVMLLLASFAIGDAGAMYWLGIPSVIAVATYAVLGWFWIVRPMQKSNRGDTNNRSKV